MEKFDSTDIMLPDIWAGHARRLGDKPAITCGEDSISWAEFNARMNALAHGLIRAGVSKGDRVAVLVSSSINACVAMFGTVKSGAIMVPISTMLTAEQVRGLLADSGARMLLISEDMRPLVDPILDDLPALTEGTLVGVDFEAPGWTHLDTFCKGASRDNPDVVLRASDPFSIMYSSGTTGAPKGVVHTHGARLYFCVSNGFEMRFDGNARGLVTTALYTAGTWLVLMPTLFCGGTLRIERQFKPDEFLDIVEREAITHTFVVPSQISMIFAGTGFAGRDYSRLRMMLSAGSPLRPDLKTRLIGDIGERFFELYGFTEGSSTLLRPEDQAIRPGSVGTPLMGQEIVTVDVHGEICGPDEPGEICGYGPGLLLEYFNKPKETREAIWRDAEGRHFIRSGDVGRIDADGFLHILDRKKDMIISGGLNIYPADLEAVLGTHEAVHDVSVVGVAHEKWGETPLAVVVLKPGAQAAAEELTAWANARLGKHQRISAVELREALPRNALGKVLKRELRAEFAAREAPALA